MMGAECLPWPGGLVVLLSCNLEGTRLNTGQRQAMLDVGWRQTFPSWVVDRAQGRLWFVRPFATRSIVMRVHLRSATSRDLVRGVANHPDTALHTTRSTYTTPLGWS